MFIVSCLVPMCWDPKEPHCCQPSVCMADLLASLFVLLCQIYSTVLETVVHSTMKAAILISLAVEFCEYNQSAGAFLLVRQVESSGCQGIEGSFIELLCPHLYVMVTWNSHLSYFTRSVCWVIRLSSLFCLQPQISNLNIHEYVWYCKSYYNDNLVAEGMSVKPEIMCSCNLKLLIHSGQLPLIWNLSIVWNRESPSNCQRFIFRFIGGVVWWLRKALHQLQTVHATSAAKQMFQMEHNQANLRSFAVMEEASKNSKMTCKSIMGPSHCLDWNLVIFKHVVVQTTLGEIK